MPAMPATFDATSAVILLSAIGLLVVVATTLGAYVAIDRSDSRAARLGLPDHSRRRRAF
jgi:hypothetical protein